MNYYTRQFQNLLKKYELDVIIVYANTYNGRYMKATAGTYPVLQNYIVILPASAYITETRYLKLDMQGRTKLKIVSTDGEDFGFDEIQKRIEPGKKIGIVGDVKYRDIVSIKPKKVVDLTEKADAIISHKTDEYIQTIASLAKTTVNIMDSVFFKTGDNILDWDKKIHGEVVRMGAELSFPVCIASGKDLKETTTVLPQNKKIAKQDMICIDMGLANDICITDRTRMYFVNHPRAEKIWKDIIGIHHTVIQTFVAPGKSFREVIGEYKRIAKKYDSFSEVLEEDFGHGIGFALHEKPILEKTNDRIQPNSIFTLEPTFVTKYGKMRIEDMIGVLSDGKVVNLTS
ncbi:M24 family metallopeptidase [Candidatus Roizmanbacteria bacterium]|nr:M24 family metallopeptidase [Candidatus Roizmanbacteria bacterium]